MSEIRRGSPTRPDHVRQLVRLVRNIRVQLHVRADVDQTGELGDQVRREDGAVDRVPDDVNETTERTPARADCGSSNPTTAQ